VRTVPSTRLSASVPPVLAPHDLELHERLGIDGDLLLRAGVRRVSDREARDRLSVNGQAGDYSGVEYPYIHPVTGYRVTSRIRLDHPPLKVNGSPDGKYRTPFGDNRHLYFVPDVDNLLGDTSVMVVIVESEKAALAVTAAAHRAGRRVLVIACGGCWGWTGRIGKAEDEHGKRVDVKAALPDFALPAWMNRRTTILFDARPNDSVEAGRRGLGRVLRLRGADVRHAHLPEDDHRVSGPDDFIAAHGDAALWHLIDGAVVEDRAGRGGASGRVPSRL